MAKDRKDKGSGSIQELNIICSDLTRRFEDFKEDVKRNFEFLRKNELESELEGVKDTKTSKNRFRLHYFSFKGLEHAAVLQNDHGPSPLVAIVNCLSLSDEMCGLGSNSTEISQTHLQTQVANLLLKKHEEGSDFDLGSAWSMVLKLATGIYVNPGFESINHFAEGSGELIFKAMGVPLFHGLVVDPEDADTLAIASGKYYGDLALELGGYKEELDVLIQGEESARLNIVKEHIKRIDGLIGGPMTEYGLIRLREELKERTPSVLYMSNHFRTIIKFKGQIYCLVTDGGVIQNKPWVTWARLNDWKGEFEECSAKFDKRKRKYEDSMTVLANLSSKLMYEAYESKTRSKDSASKDLCIQKRKKVSPEKDCKDLCIVTTPATGLKNIPKRKKVSPEKDCNFCSDVVDFSEGKTMRDHHLTHLDLENMKCNICGKKFDDQSKLWGHLGGYHAQGRSKKKKKS